MGFRRNDKELPVESLKLDKKLRVRNSDMRKGKRGGYRLIYSVDTSAEMIAPLMLYTKSHKPDISKKELKALIVSLEREISE